MPRLYMLWRRVGGKIPWLVIGTAFLVTLVLGSLGFAELGGADRPLTTSVYLTLQLFTLESGAFSDLTSISWSLEISRWTGMVTAFGTLTNTLLAIFAKQLHRLYLSLQSGHVVIIGAGMGGLQIGTDMIKSGHSVCVIEKDSEEDNLSLLIKAGAVECVGDASEPCVLAMAKIHRADMIFVLAGDDSSNLAVGNSVRIACEGSRRKNTSRVFIDISDPKLFQATCHGSSKVSFARFSRSENSARAFFQEHAPDHDGIAIDSSQNVHLVVLGLNAFARSLICKGLETMHYANGLQPSISLVAPEASIERQRMLCHAPEFAQCANMEFYDGFPFKPDTRECLNRVFSDPNQMVTVAICESSIEQSVNSFLSIAPLISRPDIKVVFQSHHSDGHGQRLVFSEYPHIETKVFGQPETSCTEKHIIGEELDELAKRIHLGYVEKKRLACDGVLNGRSVLPWDELPLEYKEMNRQQADHIAVKLRSLGMSIVACSQPDPSWPRSVTGEEIEALSEAEHRRWMACKRVAGWRVGQYRNDTLKTDPNLIPWDELPESIRDYDRKPVETLPELLAEMGYQLINSRQ